MEHLEFDFPASTDASRQTPARRDSVLVGVVSSGNLEVLVEQASLAGGCRVIVDTSIRGYGAIWQAVLADFVKRYRPRDVQVSINDAGASPAVVSLRLDQAYEDFQGDAA
jgi:malonate decarboxylase delta subunit